MTDRSPNNQPEVVSEARVSPGLFAPLQSWVALGIDLLFPPRCAGCGKIDFVWCATCQGDLDATPFPPEVRQLPTFSGMASTALHAGKIREAVQGLKYENAPELAKPLGERLSKHLGAQGWTIDMLVPVPLHITRLKERGYNQSQLLAEVITRHTSIPCVPMALQRERYTQSQVTMNAAERLTNMQHAFLSDSSIVTDRQILIIDDVYTTGATLTACGEALFSAGAKAVYGLTVTAARI